MDTANNATGTGESPSTYESLKKELIEIAAILEKYPEAIRPKVFEVLLGAYHGQSPVVTPASPPSIAERVNSATPPENGTAQASSPVPSLEVKARKRSTPDSYSIDPNLSLHGGLGVPSFQKFVEEKSPSSNYEFNAVAIYYLTKILKKPSATLKETWTCYKEVKRRTPEFFKQSFTDTKNKAGYVKISENFDLELSPRGENVVEHDLPPKQPAPKA